MKKIAVCGISGFSGRYFEKVWLRRVMQDPMSFSV
jgi:hypothetical protein